MRNSFVRNLYFPPSRKGIVTPLNNSLYAFSTSSYFLFKLSLILSFFFLFMAQTVSVKRCVVWVFVTVPASDWSQNLTGTPVLWSFPSVSILFPLVCVCSWFGVIKLKNDPEFSFKFKYFQLMQTCLQFNLCCPGQMPATCVFLFTLYAISPPLNFPLRSIWTHLLTLCSLFLVVLSHGSLAPIKRWREKTD